jgi:serine/threonine protein kinase
VLLLLTPSRTVSHNRCDFGFARDADPKSPLASVRSATPGTMTMKVGTNLWMAPEVLAGGTYDREADIFR